jgi:class 3 adenylate cyclase
MTPSVQNISMYPVAAITDRNAVSTSSVSTLLAISHSLEQTVARHALDGIFFAGFQRFSAFVPQVNRFRHLASRCKKVYVFGYPDVPLPQIENLEYAELEENAPLVNEWFLVFQHANFSAALFTRQISADRQNEFGRGRLYQGMLTFQAELVTPAAQLLANALKLESSSAPLANLPQPASTYIQEFSKYMERAQSQLSSLYQNLSDRTAALERMEKMTRTLISRKAWDEAALALETSEIQTISKRPLSILFTDIENFTPLFNAVNINDMTALLNKYFNVLATTIYQHHGDVDKFLGDGLLAFFDDPREALLAAIEIQTRLAYFNAQNAAHRQPQLNTRLGLATGDCVVARIGSDDRREVTIFGDAVNIASRLQTYSPINGVAVDEVTYKGTGSSLNFSGRDVNVKGKGIQRIYAAEFESLPALKKVL